MTATIVRRPEFKRARAYRRRHAKRHPLKRCFRDASRATWVALRMVTPEMAWFRNYAPTGVATTSATEQSEALVHYGTTGGAMV